jgi:hypothetical protein
VRRPGPRTLALAAAALVAGLQLGQFAELVTAGDDKATTWVDDLCEGYVPVRDGYEDGCFAGWS